MRGSNMATHCIEGTAGRVGFPATFAAAKKIETRKLAKGQTYTCISCHSEDLTEYVYCINAPSDNPVAHGLQCAACARRWCVHYGRTECPSCRDESYALHCIRMKSQFSLLEGEDWDREAGRLLGFLGLEGAKNALNNGIAGLIHKSAQETKDMIDKMGMTKFVEKLVESTNMVVAVEWLQNTELMASSKFAALTASMGFGALLEVAAIMIFIVSLDIWQLINGRSDHLADLTMFAMHKLPYIIIAEMAVGAGGIGLAVRWLVESGLTKTAKVLYYLWNGTVTGIKWAWCNMAESQGGSLGGSNLFHQPNDWSIRSAIREWWHGRQSQGNEIQGAQQ